MVREAGVVPEPLLTGGTATTGLLMMSKLEALAVIYKFLLSCKTLAAELVSVCFEESPKLPRISLLLGLTLGCVSD